MAYGDISQLDAEQKKVIKAIIRGGRKYMRNAPPRERRKAINTAIAVGYTESRYRNLPGGDRDSQGWRQERAMYYDDPRNLKASVKRFYDEYKADADPGSNLGDRAQAVQQSGTPDVWDSLAPLANRIRKEFSGSVERGDVSRTGTRSTRIPGVDNSPLRRSYLQGYLQNRGDPSALLELASNLEGAQDVPAKTIPGEKGQDRRRSVATRQANFDVKKDGWKGARSVGIQLSRMALKQGLTSVSEKRDTVNTASGGVSDHYTGNKDSYAWDMSNGGAPTPQMDRAAMLIAKKLGAGKQWRAQGRAGVLNVTKKVEGRTYRFQMLYRTDVGGNHYNHIHLGIDRVDTAG
jgi:hypothetical protein